MRKNLRVGKDRQLFSHGIPSGLGAVVCAAAFLLFTIPGQAQQALQVLHKHVRPAVTSGRAAPVGLLPSTQRLNLVIHLPVRNQDELTSLIDRLSDPTSPDYRHWLSVAEFTERFGRTEAEYQKVADFAAANGFAVTYKSPNRLMLVVRGSVAQMEKTFNVQMRTYQHPAENRIFYSPDREPSFALDVPVSHISGLNNYSYPHPGAGPRPAELGARNHAGGPGSTGSGPGGTFLGSDMRAAYNMGSNTGTGQTVGLAEFAGYAASDVSLYFSNIGQTNDVPIDNIVVDGGSATTWNNANDEGEVCLDIEQAVSVAPGLSQLRVYIGPESFGVGVDGYIFSQMATDNIAKQLSNSWWWSPDDPATDDPYFEEMATQGQTFFNISGDYGAYSGTDYNDMGYPAEDVHVTVVGGTALTTAGAGGAWQSEVVWNDYGEGSGGGPADDGTTYFGIPAWQAPAINSSNGGSITLRNSPDVALQADFDNYICYDRGICAGNWGGTSFAAPRWAAWLALVNQQVVANGHAAGLGFINPTIYSIGQSSSYNNDFHDITSGNNDTNGQSKFYYAVVGYDLVTGWGSMNGQPLMAALAGSAFALTVTEAGTGSGSVSSSPAGISCPSTCSANFNSGTVVTLTAAAGSGSTFAGWSGACTGTGTCSVTMNAAKSVTATFNSSGSPAVTLTPTSLNFGTVATGVTSPVKTVTLKNSGTATLTITAIAITGTNSGDFPETSTCTSSLAAGKTCLIKVQFKPSATGARSAAVSITDNAAGSPQQVPLSGTGTTAKLSPTSLGFGTLAVGLTSAVKKVTLTNVGTTALTISSIAVTGAEAADFPETATTCGSSLAAAASCTVSLTFKPSTTGARSATLKVTDNASGSPQQVPLSGTGTTAELTPTSLSFGSVKVGTTSAAKTVTLKNVGTTAITITSIAITGTEAGDFGETQTCGSSLAASASCTISVTFKPTTTGTRSATLKVTDNAAGSPQTVSLSGTGS
jgi:subtilase family serine protease